MAYEIRIGRERSSAENVEALIDKLTALKGPLSASVIMNKANGMKSVSYVDIDGGIVRGSYGERRVLKGNDFLEGGAAFS